MNTPLQVDPEEFTHRLNEAINEYNTAIAQLEAQRPAISTAGFGEGFVAEGESVAAAVNHLHEQTLRRLRGRVRQFESMLALTGDIVATDSSTAARLRAHD